MLGVALIQTKSTRSTDQLVTGNTLDAETKYQG